MPAQRCVGRDAKDAIETVGPIPVENFGTAIIAVGAQQDFRANWPGSPAAGGPLFQLETDCTPSAQHQ